MSATSKSRIAFRMLITVLLPTPAIAATSCCESFASSSSSAVISGFALASAASLTTFQAQSSLSGCVNGRRSFELSAAASRSATARPPRYTLTGTGLGHFRSL
jgi:hypothetical protein